MKSALTGGCPAGIWGRAVDALALWMGAGRAWVDAGRPRDDVIYPAFCTAEKDYNKARDAADPWAWNDAQRAEWTRVHRAFDPHPPGGGQ